MPLGLKVIDNQGLTQQKIPRVTVGLPNSDTMATRCTLSGFVETHSMHANKLENMCLCVYMSRFSA